jgi:Ulp1 family protease
LSFAKASCNGVLQPVCQRGECRHAAAAAAAVVVLMQDERPDIVEAMAAYVRMEAQEKWGANLDTRTWRRLYLKPGIDIPKQTDGFSCGVYAVVFARCLAAGFPLASCRISAGTAQKARVHIVYSIMQVRMAVECYALHCARAYAVAAP